jgi:type II secretory pathway pseudopilin PulG
MLATAWPIFGIFCGVVLLTILILMVTEPDTSKRARQLDQRIREAQRQIDEIGRRTRKAILEEIRRQQGKPW